MYPNPSIFVPDTEKCPSSWLIHLRYETKKSLKNKEITLESEVAVFGVGAVACYTYNYLKEIGIDVKCFVNNDKRMWGKKLNGVNIVQPSVVMDRNYYVIIAMTQRKYNNEVLWQLKMHHQNNFGLAFTNSFHYKVSRLSIS